MTTEVKTQHTPWTYHTKTAFTLGGGEPDPEMMDWNVAIEGISPWIDDEPESDHYGQTFQTQTIAIAKGRSPEEAEQRAMLLAAAPEMLEALKKAKDYIREYCQESEEYMERHPDSFGYGHEAWAAIQSAEAIIAKAEGRQL